MPNSSPKPKARLLPLSLLLLTAPLLTACASDPWPAEIVVAPKPPANPYRYITWSQLDTPETINQIRRHNARHARLTAQSKGGGNAGETR